MPVRTLYTCTSILMYESALQFTHPFTFNNFVHEVRKAIWSKGALGEHVMQTKGDLVRLQRESNRDNIFHCNVSLDVVCCLKTYLYKNVYDHVA